MISVAFVIGDYPPQERALREDVARSYSSADVEIGILSVPARPFDGLTDGGNARLARPAPEPGALAEGRLTAAVTAFLPSGERVPDAVQRERALDRCVIHAG